MAVAGHLTGTSYMVILIGLFLKHNLNTCWSMPIQYVCKAISTFLTIKNLNVGFFHLSMYPACIKWPKKKVMNKSRLIRVCHFKLETLFRQVTNKVQHTNKKDDHHALNCAFPACFQVLSSIIRRDHHPSLERHRPSTLRGPGSRRAMSFTHNFK